MGPLEFGFEWVAVRLEVDGGVGALKMDERTSCCLDYISLGSQNQNQLDLDEIGFRLRGDPLAVM